MKDELFGRYDICPSCGETKGLHYVIQYPLTISQTLRGKAFIVKNGKRKTRLSNKEKASFSMAAVYSEFQVAYCACDLCGWQSEPIVP